MILLIEDEEKLSRTLAEYLELNGYEVLRAMTGLEGLSMFYDHMHRIDLVLLDINASGDERRRSVKRDPQEIQYTGYYGDGTGFDP